MSMDSVLDDSKSPRKSESGARRLIGSATSKERFRYGDLLRFVNEFGLGKPKPPDRKNNKRYKIYHICTRKNSLSNDYGHW